MEQATKTWREVFREYKPKITDKEIDYILWNETCYPFDYTTVLKQIKNYFMNEVSEQEVGGNKLIAELNKMGYSILSDGRVLGKRGQFLKVAKGASGYMQLNAYDGKTKRTFLIHRLVASAFIQNPYNLSEVNHIDGNKTNNHYTNLEWVSRSDNIIHGIKTGLIKKSMIDRTGNKHWRSIPVLAYDIAGNRLDFESTGDAARKTGFNAKAIQDACSGKLKTYKNLKWKYIR